MIFEINYSFSHKALTGDIKFYKDLSSYRAGKNSTYYGWESIDEYGGRHLSSRRGPDGNVFYAQSWDAHKVIRQ